jgi:hypothetical protein
VLADSWPKARGDCSHSVLDRSGHDLNHTSPPFCSFRYLWIAVSGRKLPNGARTAGEFYSAAAFKASLMSLIAACSDSLIS